MWSKRNGAWCIHFAISTDAADIYLSLSNKIWALCLELLYTLRAISCVQTKELAFSHCQNACFAIYSLIQFTIKLPQYGGRWRESATIYFLYTHTKATIFNCMRLIPLHLLCFHASSILKIFLEAFKTNFGHILGIFGLLEMCIISLNGTRNRYNIIIELIAAILSKHHLCIWLMLQ